MNGKRGRMRRGAAIAGLLLAALAGCAEPGSDGGQARVTVGFAALQSSAVAGNLRPHVAGGLTTDIAGYTLTITETSSGTIWYSATTPGISTSTIVATG